MGCILMDVARPAYVDYGLRMQDARARIRLLRTLEWVRGRAAAGDGRTAGELLAVLPEDLRGSVRAVDIDPATGGLRMELFFDRRDTHWILPLPPALEQERRPPVLGAADVVEADDVRMLQPAD
ncbi:MAG: hypothetical protein ACTHZI_07745 [Luteimonas sp.]